MESAGRDSIPYYPLQTEKDLDVVLAAIGNSRIVLLGESSHGTHEFYTWRAALTKRLIAEKGFSFIGIEGDWVDTYKVNAFIQGMPADSQQTLEILKQYDRWPRWMWANHEFASLVQWLNHYNQNKTTKAGLYGIDVYSFWEWLPELSAHPDTAIRSAAKKVAGCLSPYNNDALKYAGAMQLKKGGCSTETSLLWQAVNAYLSRKKNKDASDFLLEQQALLALKGEKYFRTMVSDRAASWNIRDGHMTQTVNRLLQHHGPESKAIVWAHNGHVGDARYSDMSTAGYSSIGEMLRHQWPGKTFSIGFGTYKGTVAAGYQWNGPLQKVKVPAAKEGSWEAVLHHAGAFDKIILSKELRMLPQYNKWIEFRAIGAVFGEWAVYGRSAIPNRFDAFVYVDSTKSIRAIEEW